MTASLYLLQAPDLDSGAGLEDGDLVGVGVGDLLTLSGDEGRHASDVARARVGETVLVGDGRGRIATCAVRAVRRGHVEVEVGSVTHHPRRDPQFVLVQALAKGDRDLLAVESATELGVDVVVPWQAARSVSVWAGQAKAERGREKWRSRALAAAKQSRRPWVPRVDPAATTARVAELLADAEAGLVLHEEAEVPLREATLPDIGSVVLVVGPEGGVADEEIERFRAAGGVPVRLGPEVLRTSTAGPAAIAALSARSRW